MGLGRFAALAAIAAPGLMAYGGYGYGELVALFWWLLGTLILFSGPLPPRPDVCSLPAFAWD